MVFRRQYISHNCDEKRRQLFPAEQHSDRLLHGLDLCSIIAGLQRCTNFIAASLSSVTRNEKRASLLVLACCHCASFICVGQLNSFDTIGGSTPQADQGKQLNLKYAQLECSLGGKRVHAGSLMNVANYYIYLSPFSAHHSCLLFPLKISVLRAEFRVACDYYNWRTYRSTAQHAMIAWRFVLQIGAVHLQLKLVSSATDKNAGCSGATG